MYSSKKNTEINCDFQVNQEMNTWNIVQVSTESNFEGNVVQPTRLVSLFPSRVPSLFFN